LNIRHIITYSAAIPKCNIVLTFNVG